LLLQALLLQPCTLAQMCAPQMRGAARLRTLPTIYRVEVPIMPSIKISRSHGLPARDAKQAVDELAETFTNKFGLHTRWQGNTLHFERAGVNGTIELASKQVSIDAQLSFLMTPIKGRIESEIHRYLDEKFV